MKDRFDSDAGPGMADIRLEHTARHADDVALAASLARDWQLRERREKLADLVGELAVLRHIVGRSRETGLSEERHLQELVRTADADAERAADGTLQRRALQPVVELLRTAEAADTPAMALARARALRVPANAMSDEDRAAFADLSAALALDAELVQVWRNAQEAARERAGEAGVAQVSDAELRDLARAARRVAEAERRHGLQTVHDPLVEEVRAAARDGMLARYVPTGQEDVAATRAAEEAAAAERARLAGGKALPVLNAARQRAADKAKHDAYEIALGPVRAEARLRAEAIGQSQWWRALWHALANDPRFSETDFGQAHDEVLDVFNRWDAVDVELLTTLAQVMVHGAALAPVLDVWSPWLRHGDLCGPAADAAAQVDVALVAADIPMSSDEVGCLRRLAAVKAFVDHVASITERSADAGGAAAAVVGQAAGDAAKLSTLASSVRPGADIVELVALYRVFDTYRQAIEPAQARADAVYEELVDRIEEQTIAQDAEAAALAKAYRRRATRRGLTPEQEYALAEAERAAFRRVHASAESTVEYAAVARGRLAQLRRLSRVPGVVGSSSGVPEADRRAAAGAVASLIDRSGATVTDVRAVEAAWLLAEGKVQLPDSYVMSTDDRNAMAVAFEAGYSAAVREVTERPDIIAAARAEAREARDRMSARFAGETSELDEPAQRMRERERGPTRAKGFLAGRVAYLSALSPALDLRRGEPDRVDPELVEHADTAATIAAGEDEARPVGVTHADTSTTLMAVEDGADQVGPPDPYPAESAVLAERLAGLMAEAESGEWSDTRWDAARSAWEVAEAVARDADEWLHTVAAGVEEAAAFTHRARYAHQAAQAEVRRLEEAQQAVARRAAQLRARFHHAQAAPSGPDERADGQREVEAAIRAARPAYTRSALAHAALARSAVAARSAKVAAKASAQTADRALQLAQAKLTSAQAAARSARTIADAARSSLAQVTAVRAAQEDAAPVVRAWSALEARARGEVRAAQEEAEQATLAAASTPYAAEVLYEASLAQEAVDRAELALAELARSEAAQRARTAQGAVAAAREARSATLRKEGLSVADAAAMDTVVTDVLMARDAVRADPVDPPDVLPAPTKLRAVADFVRRAEAAAGARDALGEPAVAAAYLTARDRGLDEQAVAATDVAPWFVREGALGDGAVTGAAMELSPEVETWIDTVVDQALSKHVWSRLRPRARENGRNLLRAVLLNPDAASWQNWALKGKLVKIGGVPVRLTFRSSDAQFIRPDDEKAEPGLSVYTSKYGDQTVKRGQHLTRRRPFKVKLDPAIFAVGPFSAVIPHFLVSGAKVRERASGFDKEAQSGNRALVNPTYDFRSKLSVVASVSGSEPVSTPVPGWLLQKFPRAFSSLDGQTVVRPMVEVQDETALHDTDFSVNAVAVSALGDGLYQTLIDAGVPNEAALELQQEAIEHFLNEKAVKDRSQWWLSDSWVSSTLLARRSALGAGSSKRGFEGYLTTSGTVKAVQFLEVTKEPVIIRNDIADTTAVFDDRDIGQHAAAGVGATMAHMFGASHHLAVPGAEVSASADEGHGTKVSGVAQAKTAIMRKEQMVRYKAKIDFSVTVHSATHGDLAYERSVLAEVGMAKSHAQWWENVALGAPTGSGLDAAPHPGRAPWRAAPLADGSAHVRRSGRRGRRPRGRIMAVTGVRTLLTLSYLVPSDRIVVTRPASLRSASLWTRLGERPNVTVVEPGQIAAVREGVCRTYRFTVDARGDVVKAVATPADEKPFGDAGVPDLSALLAMARTRPIEIAVPELTADGGAAARLKDTRWRRAIENGSVTVVFYRPAPHDFADVRPNEIFDALHHGDRRAGWRYIIEPDGRISAAVATGPALIEPQRGSVWYVPNPARRQTAEAPHDQPAQTETKPAMAPPDAQPAWAELVTAAVQAGQDDLATYLRDGGVAQIQLDSILTERTRRDATSARSDPMDALINRDTYRLTRLACDPRFARWVTIVEANGAPLRTGAGLSSPRAAGARFVLRADGARAKPLPVQRHVVDPDEPVELAARVGLGDGVVREMPGAQNILAEARAMLFAQMRSTGVLERLTNSQLRHIERVLATRYGVPGLRSQARSAVDGVITQSFTYRDYTFELALSTKLRELRGKGKESGVALDVQNKGASAVATSTKTGFSPTGSLHTKTRVKLPKGVFSIDVHLPEFMAAWFRKRKVAVTDVVKEYRRRRPAPDVTRFEYGAVHQLSAVTTRSTTRLRLAYAASDDKLTQLLRKVYRNRLPSHAINTAVVSGKLKELAGDGYAMAVAVSHDQLPAKPPLLDDVIGLGATRVRDGSLDDDELARFAQTTFDKRVRLHENGLSGVHVTLLGVKHLTKHIDDLVRANDGVRRDEDSDAHYRRVLASVTGSEAAHPTSELLAHQITPTYLESKARSMASPHRLVIPLPPTADGWLQQVAIGLAAFDAVDDLGGKSVIANTGLEQYTETDVKVSDEQVRGWTVGTSIAFALGIRLNVRKAAHAVAGFVKLVTGQGGAAGVQSAGEPPEASLQSGDKLLFGGGGGVEIGRASVKDSMRGAMGLNVGTYRGESGKYRANAVYLIEYKRWRKAWFGSGESVSAHLNVAIRGGVGLSMGLTRAADYGLATPRPAAKVGQAAPGDLVVRHADLARGIGYIEHLAAADVLRVIDEELRRPALMSRREELDPKVLNAVAASYDEEALRAQLNQGRSSPIVRVFKTPAQFWQPRDTRLQHLSSVRNLGGTVYTAIRVIPEDVGVPAYVRARPDVLLSMGGQALTQQKALRERRVKAGHSLFGLVRVELPKLIRLYFGGERHARREEKTGEGVEETSRIIRRATAHDPAQEFTENLRFRVEIFQVTRPHLFFRKAVDVLWLLSRPVRTLGERASHRWWDRNVRPEQLATRSVAGAARTLIPTALTAPRHSRRGQSAAAPLIRVTLGRHGDLLPLPMSPLAKSLAKYAQSWATPGINSVAAWAPAAAVRDPLLVREVEQILRRGEADPRAPEFDGFAPTTADGHTIAALVSTSVQRANPVRLLRGQFDVPLLETATRRGKHITIQVVPLAARWVDRIGLTQLNFPEETVEPVQEAEVTADREWGIEGKIAGPAGPERGEYQLPTSVGPTLSKGFDRERKTTQADSAGSYEEHNLERKGAFDIYEIDVVYILRGPAERPVRVFAPGGMKVVLPAVKTTKLAMKNPSFEPPPIDLDDVVRESVAVGRDSLSAVLHERAAAYPRGNHAVREPALRLWSTADEMTSDEAAKRIEEQQRLAVATQDDIATAGRRAETAETENQRLVALGQLRAAQTRLRATEAATNEIRQGLTQTEAFHRGARQLASDENRNVILYFNNRTAGTVREYTYQPSTDAGEPPTDAFLDLDPFALADADVNRALAPARRRLHKPPPVAKMPQLAAGQRRHWLRPGGVGAEIRRRGGIPGKRRRQVEPTGGGASPLEALPRLPESRWIVDERRPRATAGESSTRLHPVAKEIAEAAPDRRFPVAAGPGSVVGHLGGELPAGPGGEAVARHPWQVTDEAWRATVVHMRAWLDAATWSQSRSYALRHPEVTSAHNEGALAEAIRLHGPGPMTVRYLDLFRRVQVHGIDRSYQLVTEAVVQSWLAMPEWAGSWSFFESHSLVLTDDHAERYLRDLVRWYPAAGQYAVHLSLVRLARVGLATWGYRYLTENDPAVRQGLLLQPLFNRRVDELPVLVPTLTKLSSGATLSRFEQADVTALKALDLILSGVRVNPLLVVTARHRRYFAAGQRLTWIHLLDGIGRQLGDEARLRAKLRALTTTVMSCT